MEKEKKGLFDRLLDFWREKIGMHESDRIGFWHDTKNEEDHFAELGAVVSLTQRETKKAFWEEATELVMADKMKDTFFAEEEEKKKLVPETTQEEEKGYEKSSKLFTVEGFREKQIEDTEGKRTENPFLWEMPDEGRKERIIVPVAEEKYTEDVWDETEPISTERSREKKTEKQEEQPVVDVENLMRQITRKLWEERESCGRRLR